MKILGITSEYNPFHNGHKHHIDFSKHALSPDATVVVMSGNFTQRGEIACFDKWTRTKCALLNGADLVVELPTEFATSSAERFSYGSVYLLNEMGATHISFGSEDDICKLNKIADSLLDKNFSVEKGSPIPFHIARQSSLDEKDIISKPNNILGVEYLKAIKSLNSHIEPLAVKRLGAGYNDTEIIDGTASASKIRSMILENDAYDNLVPENVKQIYASSKFLSQEALFSLLIYAIKSKGVTEIQKIAHIREGIENRIFKCAFESSSLDELVKNIKSKRYTYTSISRMLVSILLGIKKDTLCNHPEYIRVLGLNDNGAKALNYIKSQTKLPIITKLSGAISNLPPSAQKSLELDILASDIYYSIAEIKTSGHPDFLYSPIKI